MKNPLNEEDATKLNYKKLRLSTTSVSRGEEDDDDDDEALTEFALKEFLALGAKVQRQDVLSLFMTFSQNARSNLVKYLSKRASGRLLAEVLPELLEKFNFSSPKDLSLLSEGIYATHLNLISPKLLEAFFSLLEKNFNFQTCPTHYFIKICNYLSAMHVNSNWFMMKLEEEMLRSNNERIKGFSWKQLGLFLSSYVKLFQA